MKRRPDISVVLPSYQGARYAERHVPLLMHHLQKLGVRHEVIIVDDGSEDAGETQRIARSIGCVYLENPKNLGKGAAVRRGRLQQPASIACIRISTFLTSCRPSIRSCTISTAKSSISLLAIARWTSPTIFRTVPLVRQLASHAYSTFVGRLVAGGWFDTQCGLKGFRGDVADDLFTVTRVERFAFDVELFYVALKRHYDIKRLPVRLRVNEGSTIRMLRDGTTMVREIGAIRVNQLLGRYEPHIKPRRGIDTTPRPFVWLKARRKARAL